MLIQTLRLKRGWSQQQLAEFSGLSVRTVQRIEAGGKANAETLKSIASVFDIDFSTLSSEQEMTSLPQQRIEEEEAFQHVRRLKRFYLHLMQYIAVVSVIAVINSIVSPHYMWGRLDGHRLGFGRSNSRSVGFSTDRYIWARMGATAG